VKLTIGMAVYNDFKGLYFTLQALRLYHDLKDVELLVVDNQGDDHLRDWMLYWLGGKVRYERYLLRHGTTQPRQHVFDVARGDYTICVDSHVLLDPGAIPGMLSWIDANPECDDLLHGPMVMDNGREWVTHMEPVWREHMWGIWADTVKELPVDPWEIPMHGLGLFGARTKSWLGFNAAFKGFGGEEGYIHEKYRQHGRRVLCLPWLKWFHHFGLSTGTGYSLKLTDRIRNYLIGFWEMGLNTAPIEEHFGKRMMEDVYHGR